MSVSTLTLTTLTARVNQVLMDTGATVFSAAMVTEAIRLALQEYSVGKPLEKVATFTLTTATREHSLSTITGLIHLVRVWFPYTSTAPEYPPNWAKFQLWWSDGVPLLFLDVVALPAAAQVARLFYHVRHTLNLLDSATATTFSLADETFVTLGAAGYAALMRAGELDRQVTAPAGAAANMRQWGEARVGEFMLGLRAGGHRWRTS